MKFVKGMIIGSAATATALMMYSQMSNKTRKQMMKKSKQIMKKMGIF